jgi:hypothetical protein
MHTIYQSCLNAVKSLQNSLKWYLSALSTITASLFVVYLESGT